jgi:predicted  nucleic acid-binding Zn-ribbon protein
MLNPLHASVKNANLVDCGKKQHISSKPTALLKENFLGEFRTELDKKKVLANLGIATSLSLEWEYIQGDIGRSKALMQELDTRTKYISEIDGFQKSVIEGLKYLETIIGSEVDDETEQNDRLEVLEYALQNLNKSLNDLQDYLSNTVELNISTLEQSLQDVSDKVNNITNLIQVSTQEGNALSLLNGDNPGLYVPDLSSAVTKATEDIDIINKNVTSIQQDLESFVTKEDLGGDDFNFVNQDDFDAYTNTTDKSISSIQADLQRTVKTGEDGHVETLYVNKISKNNNEENIKITDSFEVESGIPLDVRFVVENLDALLALPANVCYEGMGVIVNSLSSLYILRKATEGVKLNQDYVSNIYNWKCPEDLVTVALSRQDYEALEEINPNVFYYIYEEEIKRTQEPKREEFGSDEEFEKAFADWVDSLKTLSQEYMSAAWGVDIENKLGKKANQVAVNALNENIKGLQSQIDSLSGGDSETSLRSLAERIANNESDLQFLLGTEGTDEEPSTQGKISEIETAITDLDTKVADQYVTKESITNENDATDFIFVKKSEYAQDVSNREEALSKKLITELVETDLINTDQITLSELPITSNGADLLVADKEVALKEIVPIIIYLSQQEYDALEKTGELNPDAYYCTNNEEIYITKTDFDTKIAQTNTSISAANNAIRDLTTKATALEAQVATLLETIESLKNRIDALEKSEESTPEPEPDPTPEPEPEPEPEGGDDLTEV